jgi:hypothetical protein
MSQEDPMAQASAAQAKYTDELMRKPHVVGVAVGLAKDGEQLTNEVALVVLVDKKIPLDQLAPEDRIPSRLDDVRVDVQEVGQIRAF